MWCPWKLSKLIIDMVHYLHNSLECRCVEHFLCTFLECHHRRIQLRPVHEGSSTFLPAGGLYALRALCPTGLTPGSLFAEKGLTINNQDMLLWVNSE